MAAAGMTICELTLNLSLNLHPCVRVAVIVVSDMNDKLSPKKAPPATIATNNGRPVPVSWAIPAAKGVNATIVPTEVPMESEMKQAARKMPPNSRFSGKVKYIFNEKLEEKKNRQEAAERKEKKQKIMQIIATKQDEALRNASVEDLQKMLDELD